MPMPLDSQVIVALVALVNAVSAGVALVITAWGHIQQPRTSGVQHRRDDALPPPPPAV